jgi:hypothetical protein
MPPNAAHVLIRLLLKIKYYVQRTAYGVASILAFFSNLNKLLLGVMQQGAGHSGSLWALTSSIILDSIMDEAQGADFHPPYYPECAGCQRTAGEAFVDDIALWIAWTLPVVQLGLMFMMLADHALMQQSAQ